VSKRIVVFIYADERDYGEISHAIQDIRDAGGRDIWWSYDELNEYEYDEEEVHA
jgi:hypothetical protein